ncbi:hypothetical protein N0V93_000005 [Gnomoniopsis smithogilvyi]|uniref:Condensation domain-containing protein n=1 Tax=Gnomoniopsis smithogilvyi TaxID=1191159 RepID=A0A9W8Z0S6_9PEZI|nr:hypothetical protein N0V93_000005 [Gnomoniopsis smithogilvyi]
MQVKAIQMLGRLSEHGLDIELDVIHHNRTLESFWRSASNIEKRDDKHHSHDDNFHDNYTKPAGHVDSQANGSVLQTGISTTEFANVCKQMGVVSDAIVRAAPITPTQEWLLEFSLQGGMILANSVYEVDGEDVESGLAQITELLEAKIPIFRSTIVQVGKQKAYDQLLLKKGNPLWIRTSNLDEYFHTTFTERLKLGGSPIQCAIVQNDKAHEGKMFFVISIQHSFFDVFSRSIMERDILQILQTPDEYAQEPERPWYGDFAKHMRSLPDYENKLSQYWSKYLDGAEFSNIHPQSLASPSGFQDGVIQWSRLEVPVSASAQQTPLVLTAWTIALARQSGLRDIVFGLARHGRSHPFQNIRRTIGPFLSLTPIRLRLGGERAHPETVRELVQRMQGEILDTARWEQGAIPGVYPDDKGNPWVQTWVNVKSELYTMGNGYREGNASKRISKFVPRSDLHPLWMKSHWAVCLLIYFKHDGVEACAGYRTSLIGHDKAKNLFADFKVLIKELADEAGNTVDGLLK